jgi:hypothetical protein
MLEAAPDITRVLFLTVCFRFFRLASVLRKLMLQVLHSTPYALQHFERNPELLIAH